MKRRRFLLAGAASLLSGCGLLSAGAPPESLDTASVRFAASGRLSLRQGEHRNHLGFDWTHSPERDTVLFLSPLGQGLAELGRDAMGAWLLRPGEPEQRAADLSSLAQQVFGAPLPLEILPDWLRGAHGSSGEADGWRIAITEVAQSGKRSLPRRIEVRREDIELLILIDNWNEDG